MQSEDFDFKKLTIRTERRNLMRKDIVKHSDDLHLVNSSLAMGTKGSDLYIKTVDRISSYVGDIMNMEEEPGDSDLEN